MKYLMIFFLSTPTYAAQELWLKVGEIRNLPAARSAKVRVGSRGIIRAVDGDQVIRLIGLKPGFTNLVVDEQTYSVRVSPAGQKEFVTDLRHEVEGLMGLKLNMEGSLPVIQGTLLRFEDWPDLAEIARRHHGEYSFRAQALPDVATEALTMLTQLAQEHGYPVLRYTAAPEFTAILPQAAKELKVAVEQSLKPYGIHIEMSESNLAIQPLVKTRVIIAEVDRSFSRQYGIQWPAEYQAQVLPKLGGGDGGLMVSLKAMEQSGQAQILASPNLLCRSGSEARFHAGGEFPIKIVSRRFQDVIWKSHGVILTVKPRADFQGAISLEIETEVSLLDTAHAVDGIPALKVNNVKSHFDLPGRRTIALSGLLRQELGNSTEGLPLLSGLPVLGPLFSSRNFQKHQSELVIFVTPEVSTPESDEKIEMPEGWVRFER